MTAGRSRSSSLGGVDQEFRPTPLVNSKNHRRASKPIARCYLVAGPEYGTAIPILDDGTGPMEYGCDVVHVFARNARRAKVLAVRWFRRQYAGNWRHTWLEDGNPFTGVKAFDLTSETVEGLDMPGAGLP